MGAEYIYMRRRRGVLDPGFRRDDNLSLPKHFFNLTRQLLQCERFG